jgi:hypothetical protein
MFLFKVVNKCLMSGLELGSLAKQLSEANAQAILASEAKTTLEHQIVEHIAGIRRSVSGGQTDEISLYELCLMVFGDKIKADLPPDEKVEQLYDIAGKHQGLQDFKEVLKRHTGQYILIDDTGIEPGSHPDEDLSFPFRYGKLGIIPAEPLSAGKGVIFIDPIYFLRLNFEGGKYIYLQYQKTMREMWTEASQRLKEGDTHPEKIKIRRVQGSSDYKIDTIPQRLSPPYHSISIKDFSEQKFADTLITNMTGRFTSWNKQRDLGIYIGNEQVLAALNNHPIIKIVCADFALKQLGNIEEVYQQLQRINGK